MMAFDTLHHCARVVGQSSQGCFVGSHRSAFGVSWGQFCTLLAVSWGHIGGLLGPLPEGPA
eukprot:5865052-Pyramimonas_sp.AAC.1